MSLAIQESKILDSLSIVIPAYNEQSNIEWMLDEALETALKYSKKFEIIVVDDGSQDETYKIVTKRSHDNNQIRVIRHPKNIGSGSAIWTGFLHSKYSYIFYTDADRQFRIKDIDKLIPHLAQFDIVLGYRKKREDHIIRIIYSQIWRKVIKILFNLDVRDINCAFKIFNRKVLDSIKVKSKGAFVNTEIMLQLKKRGFYWKEVEIEHYPRLHGQQSGGRINVIFKAIFEMIYYYFNKTF